MKRFAFEPTRARLAAAAVALTLAVGLAAGCKHQAPAAPNDQQIATDIQTKLGSESALSGQDIHVSVANGVATLDGTVSSDAARALAGNEAGTIGGVKTVVNNLTVQPEPVASAQPQQAMAPAPAQVTEKKSARRDRRQADTMPPPAPAPQPAPMMMQQQAAAPPPPPPPPPPKPVIKDVTLPAGTVVPVRITETLDSKTAQTNDAFHGSLAGDLMVDGVVAIPHGTAVMGRIADAKDAGHFKGSALLSLELTQATVRGRRVTLTTETYSQQGSGRGKNTAEKAGGGGAFGAIVGALAGGGKGAAIGGLAGAAAGTGINAATRGQQVVIQSETLINFRLQSPVTVTVTIPPQRSEQSDSNNEPVLQKR